MNRLSNRVREEHGYTLAELLTVFAVAGLLFVMSLWVWMFAQEYINRWSRSVQSINKMHLLSNSLTDELFRASEIKQIRESELTLMIGDSLRIYTTKDGKLIRNNQPIQLGEVRVVSLHFHRIYRTETEDVFEPDSMNKLFATGIDLQIALREDTLTAFRMVYPRKPILWEPIR